MVGHGGSSAGSYLADPTTSPIPSHCASIVMTGTLRVNVRIYLTISYLASSILKISEDNLSAFIYRLS